jgi:FlaA1/EpsC-like NDP-sugar epimerase
MLLAALITGERLVYRLLRNIQKNVERYEQQAPTMLIGAGSSGAIVLRDLRTSEMSRNRIVCIIDDDGTKWGRKLSGVPIVGGRNDIGKMVKKYGVHRTTLRSLSFHLMQEKAGNSRSIQKI